MPATNFHSLLVLPKEKSHTLLWIVRSFNSHYGHLRTHLINAPKKTYHLLNKHPIQRVFWFVEFEDSFEQAQNIHQTFPDLEWIVVTQKRQIQGLYYYGARYYDAKTSVWQSVDPLVLYDPVMEVEAYLDGQHNGGVFNSGNLASYSYTYGNPIKYIDPNGKQTNFNPFESYIYKVFMTKNWNRTGSYGYGPNDKFDCVTVVNRSMRELLGDPKIPARANMDDQMNTMKSRGQAGKKMTINFKNAKGNKTLGVTNPSGFLDKSLSEMIETVRLKAKPRKDGYDYKNGYQYYGISVMDGYHSIVLEVDNTDLKNPMYNIYDQHGSVLGSNNSSGAYTAKEIDNWLLNYVSGGNINPNGSKGKTTTTVTPIEKQ